MFLNSTVLLNLSKRIRERLLKYTLVKTVITLLLIVKFVVTVLLLKIIVVTFSKFKP